MYTYIYIRTYICVYFFVGRRTGYVRLRHQIDFCEDLMRPREQEGRKKCERAPEQEPATIVDVVARYTKSTRSGNREFSSPRVKNYTFHRALISIWILWRERSCQVTFVSSMCATVRGEAADRKGSR